MRDEAYFTADPQLEWGNQAIASREICKNVYINKLHHFGPPENISWLRS